MSETHDGNDGWRVEDGDVLPPNNEPVIKPQQPYINRAELALEHPEHAANGSELSAADVIDENFDSKRGLTPKEARVLNKRAEDERGGHPVNPDVLR